MRTSLALRDSRPCVWNPQGQTKSREERRTLHNLVKLGLSEEFTNLVNPRIDWSGTAILYAYCLLPAHIVKDHVQPTRPHCTTLDHSTPHHTILSVPQYNNLESATSLSLCLSLSLSLCIWYMCIYIYIYTSLSLYIYI